MKNAPYIPDNAPFNDAQRSWLNGFLAGLYSESPIDTESANTKSTPVTITFGSQTGTAETLSKRVAKQLKAANCEPTVLDMNDMTLESLSSIKNLLLITSTYGEGEPPDNAQSFHEALMAENAPSLEGLNYSVFGLGDSTYPDFCQCSRDFDNRLESLGANRVAATVEADGDPDDSFSIWAKTIVSTFNENVASDTSLELDEPENTASQFNKNNPFLAKIIKSENLNKKESSKATHHVEISLKDSDIKYNVGDALSVIPKNEANLVSEIITESGLSPNEMTRVPNGEDETLFKALLEYYDIGILNKSFLLACARLTKNELLSEIIADEEKLKTYLSKRGVIDPIVDFNIKFPTSDYLVATLKALKPRLYSISSSQNAHNDAVHLTVGVVHYQSHGRERHGVCSSYLAKQERDMSVQIYLHENKAFHLTKDDDAPIIMIGPGTGIAPFRAFLEEREARGAKGKNWLFFGDQHKATDYLYEEQIADWLDSKLLTRIDTAFSRDQSEKIYVQNRISENAEAFYNWLEAGCYIYVCGDASRMAKDVDQAIHEVVETVGSLSKEDAKAYVNALKQSKRYLRDVY